MLKKVKANIALFIYYFILKNLPSTNSPYALIVVLRSWVCKSMFKKMGRHVNIQKGVYFGKGDKISIGDYSGIGENSILGQTDEIQIGNNVLTGPQLMIFTQNHEFKDRTKLIREQGGTNNPVTIEDDVWIGTDSIILSGVTLGKGTIVAAGSIVTKSTLPYSVIGGNPAKLIKKRFDDDLIKLLLDIDFSKIDEKKIHGLLPKLHMPLDGKILLEIKSELLSSSQDRT